MDNESSVESSHIAAVSNLRSRFEQLSSSSGKPASINVRLAPMSNMPEIKSPHPRPPHSEDLLSPVSSDQHLRPTSASSFRPSSGSGFKRQPPESPASRRSSPSNPVSNSSPLLRPVPPPPFKDTGKSNELIDLTSEDETTHPSRTASVASLRSRFANDNNLKLSSRISAEDLVLLQDESSSFTALRDIFSNGVHQLPTPDSEVPPKLPRIPPRKSPPRLSGTSSLSSSPINTIKYPSQHSSDVMAMMQSVSSSSGDPFVSPDPNQQMPILAPASGPPPIMRPRRSLQFPNGESVESEPAVAPLKRPPPPPPPFRSARSIPETVPLARKQPPPPPLPTRRATAAPTATASVGEQVCPPPLPSRPQVDIPATFRNAYAHNKSDSSLVSRSPATPVSAAARKALGTMKHLPPPTRTIAIGDKLPPVRRDEDSSEEEEDDSDDLKNTVVMPDASRSSRRPPILSHRDDRVILTSLNQPGHHQHNVKVSSQACAVACGSRVVVAKEHHVKVYDVSVSDVMPTMDANLKDIGLKDDKVLAMVLKEMNVVWIGTKHGHLIQLDISNTSGNPVQAYKLAAHLHPIVHMFKQGESMISIDESGKVLIFPTGDFMKVPRVVRVTEKLDIAAMLDGRLWTAARSDKHKASGTPNIRVTDVFAGTPGIMISPTTPVGCVTDATALPSIPNTVYVGHEGGCVSVWESDIGGGNPRCVDVVKISGSDVLCIEGVNGRLWVGQRNGFITAYDPSNKPWVVTNSWEAHGNLPVTDITVDWFGQGKLAVASIGRDENLRLWDGLLALDWQDAELSRQEDRYSSFRDLKVLMVSWNCDSARPETLSSDPGSLEFLPQALQSTDSPDVIVFGLQEVVDLESHSIQAKSVVIGQALRSRTDDDPTFSAALSEKVTGAYRRWFDHACHAVRLAMPPECPYTPVTVESMIGLFTVVFVKNTERLCVKDVNIASLKRGMGGRYGNKGGIMARMVVDDTSLCFINCHLAAGQHALRSRNADIAAMLECKPFRQAVDEPLAYVGGGDGTMVLDHEIVFFAGDTNYRIDQRRDPIFSAVESGDYESLVPHDQLCKEMKFNRGFRLRGFAEGPLSFAPTYKYDRMSDMYDSGPKQRLPAWCDRVLWRAKHPERVHQEHYQRYEARISDHRPISAAFNVKTKNVDKEARNIVKEEVKLQWREVEATLLDELHQYALAQRLL